MTEEREAFLNWFHRSGFWNNAITEKAWMAALAWQAARATPADHISQARDAVIEQCAKACEAWSAEVDATNNRNRVVTAAMTGALSCAAAIRALTTPSDR